jgi:hypothetical protein
MLEFSSPTSYHTALEHSGHEGSEEEDEGPEVKKEDHGPKVEEDEGKEQETFSPF